MDHEVEEIEQTTEMETKKAGYFRWTRQMDGVLLEILKEQKVKGLKDDRNFQGEAYRVAVDAINQQFKLNINRTHINNRLKTLKEQMGLAIELLHCKSGFTWNDMTKTIVADKQVWDDLIKGNSRFKNIRGKEIYHLDLLREIFEKDRATGDRAESAKEKVHRWQREETELRINDIDQMQAHNEVHLESFEDTEINSFFSPQSPDTLVSDAPSVSTSSSKRKKKQEREKNIVNEEIKMMTASLDNIANAINNATDLKRSNESANKLEKVVAMLKDMSVEDDVLMDAIDLFQKDPNLCDGFFACPSELRARWLFRKMSENV